MEGIPLALDAERPPMLELLVIGNVECSILHYKGRNTAIETSVKFVAQAKRGLHSHSLNPLCFVSSNIHYFSSYIN